MDNSIIEQPTFAASTTTEKVTTKSKPRDNASVSASMINMWGGAVIGLGCSPLISVAGSVPIAVLIGAAVGVCSSCTSTLLLTKSVVDRVVVINEQPTNAPNSTLDPVEPEEVPMALTYVQKEKNDIQFFG